MLTTRRSRWTSLLALALVVPLLFTVPGCTDLGEETFGIVTPENFYQTEGEILAALAPVYAQLRANLWAYHNLSQVSSDENIVPTRGSDWFDNGRWLDIHRFTWTPALVDLNDAWVASYTGVARANALLETLETVEVDGRDGLVAELRTLRAYYYYQLIDLFGNVPIVGDDEFIVDPDNPPATQPRNEVFAFIESELQAARNDLPQSWDDANYGRLTQSAADALLASLYINAEVFTGTVTASGLQRGQARWQDAIDAVDRILNSGQHSLLPNWFDNFSVENANNPEALMVAGHVAVDGLGLTLPHRALHYNQLNPAPWNGFATLAETYSQFSETDDRRDIFLEGQAFNFETGEAVDNRQGEPLIFTPDIENPTSATEGEGIRIMKFAPDVNNDNGNHANDYPFFRLAEMYLIKAEALNELNGPTQEAIDQINTIRERVFEPDEPLNVGDFDQASLRERIFQERLFELTSEAKRRQDLVRAGDFLNDWQFKERNDPYRVLFPIPQTQRDANPNLTQNPGY